MILKATSSKKVAMKVSKSISKLLKEAWRIKTKVAAQAKKCFKAVKKMSNLALLRRRFSLLKTGNLKDWTRDM